MGLGQAAREVRSRLGCDEFHRSGLIQLAMGEAVRSRVARVGEEGLEASTRATVLAWNRATDDQRIVTTRIRAPMARHNVQTQAPKYLSTISPSTVTTTDGHQRCDDRLKVQEPRKPDTSNT